MISKQLTIRSIIIATVGSIIITASSMYVALRMSALPWPTIFVAILSMALIKITGNSNIQEINIAQTGMSAGAMVAGGLSFTLPGLWISGIFKPFDPTIQSWSEWMLPKATPILCITLAGTIAGTLLCYAMRKKFIESDQLPFPIGSAATQTLIASDSGGKKFKILFSTMAITALFTLFRDSIKLKGKTIIPQGISWNVKNIPIEFIFSPMALGIGYIIGFIPAMWWFLGAIFSNILLKHFFITHNIFLSIDQANNFTLVVAIGLMVGAGIGILVQFFYKKIKIIFQKYKSQKYHIQKQRVSIKKTILFLCTYSLVFAFSLFSGLSSISIVLLLVGLVFAATMSANITGQTGINPMEIFGILILLAIRYFINISPIQAFSIVGITAVTCGFTGDMLNDYKMGFDLGTDPKAQTIAQLIGAVIGSIVSVIALFAIIAQYNGVGGESGLTAAQAHTVASMINGIGNPVVFTLSFGIGLILYLLKIPTMIIGIGMILPLGMSNIIFIGGILEIISKKLKKPHIEISGQIISAGLLGGEGLVGTLIALFKFLHF